MKSGNDSTHQAVRENKVTDRSSYWQKRVFLSLWLGYFCYYLCRHNIGVALPGLIDEFGLTMTRASFIGGAFFITYALGQFINGQLGDKLGARRLVTAGLILTGVLNLVFGFCHVLTTMVIIWGINGYFQSTGWSPSIKALANWFPARRRGKVAGLFATSPGVGTICAWLVSAFLVEHLGWRYAFYLPAALAILAGAAFPILCRNSPEDIGLPAVDAYTGPGPHPGSPAPTNTHAGFRFTLKQTVGNPKVWCIALGYMGLSIVSYGFLYWAPTYMAETQGLSITASASRLVIMPLAGSLGGLVVGWATDRFFGSRRVPLIVIMALAAGLVFWFFPVLVGKGYLVSTIILALAGFFAMGAHVAIVTMLPMDFGTRTAAASVAGFIDSAGYLAAGIAVTGTGQLVDRYGWDLTFPLWAGGAVAAAAVLALLWNHKPIELDHAAGNMETIV